MAKDTVTITANSTGKSVEVPIMRVAPGPPVLDVRSLSQAPGTFTPDTGLLRTLACERPLPF